MSTIPPNETQLREQLISLLTKANAHATFDQAIANLPANLRGTRPAGLDHSPWELLEHLRFSLRDILDFCRDPDYREREWPADYWPKSPAPPSEASWDDSVQAFCDDLDAICHLVSDPATDLYARIPWGTGQTILREALLVADHNAYHVGQLILVRKLLGAWH